MPVKDQTDLWMYPMLTNSELMVTQNESMHSNTEFTCQIKVCYYLEASYKYLGTKVCVKLKPKLLNMFYMDETSHHYHAILYQFHHETGLFSDDSLSGNMILY